MEKGGTVARDIAKLPTNARLGKLARRSHLCVAQRLRRRDRRTGVGMRAITFQHAATTSTG
jgi:hypothetical protein